MANPFDGLISDDLLNNFKLAINEVIRACEVPCRLYFPTTKYTDCTSCEQSISQDSPNPYLSANKGRFTTSCNECGGTSKIPVENYEDINLCIVWDYKKFKDTAGIVFNPQGDCQTFCKIALIEKIKSCKYAIFDTNIQYANKHQFVRDGEPKPAGFGENAYLITPWRIAS